MFPDEVTLRQLRVAVSRMYSFPIVRDWSYVLPLKNVSHQLIDVPNQKYLKLWNYGVCLINNHIVR